MAQFSRDNDQHTVHSFQFSLCTDVSSWQDTAAGKALSFVVYMFVLRNTVTL